MRLELNSLFKVLKTARLKRNCFFLFFSLVFLPTLAHSISDSLLSSLQSTSKKEQFEIWNRLSHEFRYTEPSKSLEYTLEAYKIAELLQDEALLLKVYDKVIQGYLTGNNSIEAYRFSMMALETAEKSKSIYDTAFYLNSLGVYFFKQDDYQKALDYYQKALEIEEKNNLTLLKAGTLNNMGGAYIKLGKLDKSLNYFLQSLKLKEELGNQKNIAASLINIGSFLNRQKKYHEALEYLERAYDICDSLNLKVYVSQYLSLLSISYRELQMYDKAEKTLANLVQITESIGNAQDIAQAYNKFGLFYFHQNKLEEGIGYFKIALNLSQEANYESGISVASIHLQRSYAMLQKHEQAEYYLTIIEKNAHILKDIEIKMNALRFLSEYYESRNDFTKTFHYFKDYITLRDSLQNMESRKNVERLQMEFETEKKEKEIEILTKSGEIQKLEISKQRTLQYFFLLGFTLLFLVSLNIYKSKMNEIKSQKAVEKEIRKLNQELEFRVEEELKKREKQNLLLIQKSKLESLGKLAAGIAHEINQPLSRLSLGTDNVMHKIAKNKEIELNYLEHKCKTFQENILRIKNIIEHIRTFSRNQQSIVLENIDLNKVIHDVYQFIETQYKNKGINLILELDEDTSVIIGNRFKLEQIFLNLLSNARDAIEEKFKATDFSQNFIRLKTYKDDDFIYFEISDNGIGISEENLTNIFDPFFTTKSIEKGTGLGLSIIYGLIQEMKSEITVESKQNVFTVFRIKFPNVIK
jgi:signal transduction histidine kinase/Tfp pilus assembly protein PilF